MTDTANHANENIFETSHSTNVDSKALEAALVAAIKGEVRFDEGSRALYSTDASNYRQMPIGVVLPMDEQDVITTIGLCRKYHAPLLSRGGGTSLAGQCCNVAVVMDMSKYYNKVLALDTNQHLVRVQPGIVLDEMKEEIAKHASLTFGPDPATHSHCTIGGMLGNNSCGVHSVMSAFRGDGARTSDNTHSVTVITYRGARIEAGAVTEDECKAIIEKGDEKAIIYKKLLAFRDKYAALIREKFPKIPRRVSGYNLPALLPENGFNVARALVGSESTCVTIIEATLKLLPAVKYKSLLVLGYPDVYEAASDVIRILKHQPIGLEGIDDLLISYMKKKGLNTDDIPLLPEGKGWLLVEFDGNTKEESDNKARQLMDELKTSATAPAMNLFDDPVQEKKLWEVRESGLGATAWVPGEPMSVPGWEDSAVNPENVAAYLKDLRELFTKYGYNPSVYGHFGQGCIHCRIQFDLFTKTGLEKYYSFTQEAAKLVVKYGGSVSGEHGDGQARGDLLEIMYGKELVQAFHEFKAIWDPDGMMNPGKIINTYGQLSNLRINNTYNPPAVKTFFNYAEDNGSFARASLRCVGVGKCRRHEGGTMCPSYMVTKEEKHSTRGRARMLFEMMEGDVVTACWKDKAVKNSLDLCLSCKGCKSDCPVNVDMATYKAEFLAHYYKDKLRPLTAYVFGWIYWWSRLASLMPRTVNFLLHLPLFSSIAKQIAGIAQQRVLPRFATCTFRDWFKARQPKNIMRPKVILWPDTFNNYFLPQTLAAGTEVLEAAGFRVVIPPRPLCCGRPLYDFGMLNTARKMLLEILHTLKQEIENDVPVVGLEPSCVAVFRDELLNLFPNNEDAKKLKKNVFTLAEFLEKKCPGFQIPKIELQAIVHIHCHHKAVLNTEADIKILAKTGLDLKVLDSGCCGMAGYFGYENGSHYDVSVAVGERVLLPAVRSASPQALIIADGFSCREQVEQQTNRKAMHTAQVLQMALHEKKLSASRPYPEKKYVDGMKLRDPSAAKKALFKTACFLLLAATVAIIKYKKYTRL